MSQFLGLGKTKYNSSICLIDDQGKDQTIELLLTERLNRQKNSGLWPEAGLKYILPKLKFETVSIAENRDVHLPWIIEDIQDSLFPFYTYLEKNNLLLFASRFNPKIKYVSHHFCHAYAALALSPFEKSIIIVMDGAGTEIDENEFEECTVFLQNEASLNPVYTRRINFMKSSIHAGHTFGNAIGASYEKAAEFIFNSPHSSGKVMGLAPFGKKNQMENYLSFQENLDWRKSFKGKSKSEWEKQKNQLYFDVAATVQGKLEENYQDIIMMIKKKYPDYEHLILTGGCALNCSSNAKIFYKKLFKKIFIPPFPGDESVSFGLAHYLKFTKNPLSWEPVAFENQAAYFGAISSIPTSLEIEKEFDSSQFEIKKVENIEMLAAKILTEGKIIAWFQGRSESGPRALGNRSILVRPDMPGIKDKLNKSIKFRENFRPYGCSVLHSKGSEYFEVDDNFDNPYMSYAIRVRNSYKDALKEVSHVDGTSRMQTVRVGQNKKFHELIKNFGDLTGLYCLLNTSLNVMDEPILETVKDARRFMENALVDYLVIDDFLIKKKV